jgi:hypothetical protein
MFGEDLKALAVTSRRSARSADRRRERSGIRFHSLAGLATPAGTPKTMIQKLYVASAPVTAQALHQSKRQEDHILDKYSSN